MRRPVSGRRPFIAAGLDRGALDGSTTSHLQEVTCPPPPRPTILLADEDDATRAFLADNLTADGYRVLVAARPRQGARAAEHRRSPDLIVVDINGETLELLDAVRCGEGLAGRIDPDVPLIVLSRRRRPAAARSGCSSAAATTSSRSRSPTRSCAPGSARCCAARSCDRRGARIAARRAGRDRRALARGARVRSAGRAVGDGVRAAGRRSPASRPGVHARRS